MFGNGFKLKISDDDTSITTGISKQDFENAAENKNFLF
jgi:hypothetical protein